MSDRRVLYVCFIVAAAVIFSLPQMFVAFQLGSNTIRTRSFQNVLNLFPGQQRTYYYYEAESVSPFWQDRFLSFYPTPSYANGQRGFTWRFRGTDPETRHQSDLDISLTTTSTTYLNPMMAIEDRIWLCSNQQVFEIVDGVGQPSTKMTPLARNLSSNPFLWQGEPAHLSQSGNLFSVMTWQGNSWKPMGTVDLLFDGGNRVIDGEPISLAYPESLICFSQGGLVHVYLQSAGRVCYREGLSVKPELDGNTEVLEPVSAIAPSNTGDELKEWSLVYAEKKELWRRRIPSIFPMMIEQQPAVLIVEDVATGQVDGRVIRFDGSGWKQVAKVAFPFGSSAFRAVVTSDKKKSYIVATTTSGVAHVYAAGADGIRKTNGGSVLSNSKVLSEVYHGTWCLIWTLVLGIVLGMIASLAMSFAIGSRYEFGNQSVELGSLTQRGIARLIDVAIIALTLGSLAWVVTLGLDWHALAEARNLKLDDPTFQHPTVHVARRAMFVLAGGIATAAVLIVIMQARWGVTPGKWLLGLKTVRTTLRPCGFAQSLARELVLLADSCSFLCWTPGIVSIALTENRQRLGDLVADTLVIRTRTLKTNDH